MTGNSDKLISWFVRYLPSKKKTIVNRLICFFSIPKQCFLSREILYNKFIWVSSDLWYMLLRTFRFAVFKNLKSPPPSLAESIFPWTFNPFDEEIKIKNRKRRVSKGILSLFYFRSWFVSSTCLWVSKSVINNMPI